ncbi:response regulator [Chitinispirillales bacterium ANBcel5]|uniref:response regulator n=1 Tax=Cellulosispirillum alkaliphilum TaxID=3039283 RepID=UPI002A546044|nr:response regulator [Chitinispirillales bacterium ANBcel5]
MSFDKRILIVDDETAILLAFKRLLQRPGIEVVTSESLSEAKEKIDRSFFDAVIADLRLSGTFDQEGFEIIKFTRSKYPQSKIALITAYGSNGIKEEAKKLGADFYFEKPVSKDKLSQILDSLG